MKSKVDTANDDKMKEEASAKPTPKKTNSRKRARTKAASPAKSVVDRPVPCVSSILGDDLILCRLSALLPPPPQPTDLDHLQNAAANNTSRRSSRRRSSTSSTDSTTSTSDDDAAVVDNRRTTRSGRTTLRRPKLVRKVSSALTDEEDNSRSTTCSSKGDSNSFSLIPGDVAVVLPPELRHPSEISVTASIADNGENSTTATTSIDNPLQHLLRAVGIEEVEALDPNNGGPAAGQCQFACIATVLSHSYGTNKPLQGNYRPDLELRRLALHVIRMNPDLYRNFLTVAGGRTRKHSQAGGSGVDIEAYLRTMSNPSCDGDAVTLQALCDALKITIRVVKPVAADMYDEERQQRLLQEYYAGIPTTAAATTTGTSVDTASSTPTGDVCSSDEEGYATAIEEDDDDMSSTSSLATAYSSLSWSDNPYSACTGIRGHIHSICPDETASSIANDATEDSVDMNIDPANPFAVIRQRLYVSQEIRPRRLDRVDTRIRDVQKTTRGRLIWLSHIGDEAHYRFLRPLCSRSTCATASECPHGPVNEEEATIARRSQESRRRQLNNLLRSQEDGYVRPYKPQGRGRSSSMDRSVADATENIVSTDKLQRLRKLLSTTSDGENDEASTNKSPRCGLCFQDFFDAQAKTSTSTKGVGVASSSSTNSPSKPAKKSLAPASPSKSLCTVSPSGCNHDFCRSCIQAWVAASNEMPTCPTCSYPFLDLIDQNLRTVTPAPIENDICCMTISNENTIVLSTKTTGSRDKKLEQEPSTFVPPSLPTSFSWSEAISPSTKSKVPPSIMSFNRQMLAEVSHELRFGEQMESPMDLCRRMGQVASMVDGPQLENLLGANILRTFRLLLTPVGTESAIRNVEVTILGENVNRYVVSDDIFRASVAIIERITQKSQPTIDAIHDSLDLPKLLLWYMSCSELRNLAGYAEGLAAAKRIIGSWSTQHSHTIVDALGDLEAAERKALEAKRKAARPMAAAARPPPTKKQKMVATVSSSVATGTKKNPPVKRPAPSKKPPIVRVLPKLPPPALIRRGAGKRTVRPPAVVNISAQDLSMRDWRQK